MQTPASARRRPRLLPLFVLAALLPAAALGWLGWRLIEQDRQLERQRVQVLVEGTADRAAAAIERELGAIDRGLGTPSFTLESRGPASALIVGANREGGTTLHSPASGTRASPRQRHGQDA